MILVGVSGFGFEDGVGQGFGLFRIFCKWQKCVWQSNFESSGLFGWVWDFRVEGGEISGKVQIKKFISAVS